MGGIKPLSSHFSQRICADVYKDCQEVFLGGLLSDKLKSPAYALRFLRKSQASEDQAKQLYTRQTIIAIEGSKYSPSLSLAFRRARVFGGKIEAVFEWD